MVVKRDELRRAVYAGDVHKIHHFLRGGLSPDTRLEGKPLLVHVAQLGNVPVAKLLVNYGATVDALGSDGYSALSWAARTGHTALAKLLADKGADVNQRSRSWGITPLMSAAMGGHLDTVRFLLNRRARVNDQDFKRERTPLLWAIRMTVGSVKKKVAQIPENAALDVVALLLAHGAEVGIRDYQQKTPLQRAMMNKQHKIAHLLRFAIESEQKVQNEVTPNISTCAV